MGEKEDPANNRLLSLYETMRLIRSVELELSKLFADGEIPGFIHSSIGQEAVAAGVTAALESRDTIVTTHRGHGHVLAKGIHLESFFAEVLGRAEGTCRGRGGSMHVADIRRGILGANGIVAGGIPIALGSALAHKRSGAGGVSVAFFGDGAIAEGILHECFNLSSLWNLPMLFVCENNGWAEFSPFSRVFAGDFGALAKSFNLLFENVDGNDVDLVARKAEELLIAVRGKSRPAVLECRTKRVRGHYEGDPQKYRNPDELHGPENDDPIERLAGKLRGLPGGEEEIRTVDERVTKSVEIAKTRARAGRLPEFEQALGDVYAGARREPV